MSATGGDGTPPGRSFWRPLIVLCAAYLALRTAVVVALGDVFFYGEELEKGAAAKALVDDLGVDTRALVYHAYEGGGFVASHLAALVFRVVGENVLALKVVALGWGTGILAAGYALCWRAWGRTAAVVFGLLLVFAPASFQRISLLSLGIHYEAQLFALAILLCAGRILFERDERVSTWALFGLAAGFGTFCSYQTVIPFGIAGVALLARRASSLVSRPAIAGWVGLVVGLAPLLWMYAYHGDGVFDIHGQSLVSGETRSTRDLVGAFLTSVYGDRSLLDLATLLVLPLTAALALFALGRWTLWVGAYLFVYALAYLTSGFAVGEVTHYFAFERLTPFFLVWLLLTAAGASAALARGGRVRVAAQVLLALVVASGVRDTVAIVRAGNPGSPGANVRLLTSVKGYQYTGYLKRLAPRLDGTLAERFAVLARFDEPDPALLHQAIGADLFADGATPLEDIARAARVLGAGAERDVFLGLGPRWMMRHGPRARGAVTAASELPEPWDAWTVEAVGRFAPRWLATEAGLARKVAAGLEAALPEAYFRGLGWRLQNVRARAVGEPWFETSFVPYPLDERAARAFIAATDGRARAALEAGYEDSVEAHRLR